MLRWADLKSKDRLIPIGIGAFVLVVGMVGAIVADDEPSTSAFPLRRGLVTLSEAEAPPPLGAPSAGAVPPSGLAVVKAPNQAVRPRYVPRELLIRFDPGISPAERSAARADLGVRRLRSLPVPGLELVALAGDRDVASVRARAANHPRVVYSEPNFIYRASATPDDPAFPSLWSLHNEGQSVNGRRGNNDADIDAPEAWDRTTDSKQIQVAVADSGIAYDHPDLAGNVWTNRDEHLDGVDNDGNGFVDDVHGWDWVGGDPDPRDQHGHGTHVAGTIGAVGGNGLGVAGVAWSAHMIPLRVLDAHGEGTTADVASAFSYAIAKGVEVVNVSFGGPDHSRALLDVIRSARNTLFVAAAGNEAANNDTSPTYPCNYDSPNIVCVAASGMTDAPTSFTNRGAASVDLAAPGSTILSTIPEFEQVFADSFSTDLAGRWSTGGTATWGRTSDGYASDSPAGSYANSTDASMALSQPLDLSRLAGCRVEYRLRLDTAVQDGIRLEATTELPGWTRLSGWSGSSNGEWITVSDDLSDFDDEPQVYLRFRFVSDGSSVAGGADIDDVLVECSSSDYSGNEFAFQSGTSMAAPHVTGAAALLWAAAPDLDPLDVSDLLLSGVDPVTSLAGVVATGGRLNVARSLALAIGGSSSEAAPEDESTDSAGAQEEEGSSGGGGGGGGGGGYGEPEEEETSSPSREPSPTASDEGSQPAAQPTAAARSVSLTLKRHLVAKGTVRGEASCTQGVLVKIRRKNTTVARVRTAPDGSFRVRLPDRNGRYVAKVAGADCEPVVSNAVSHRH